LKHLNIHKIAFIILICGCCVDPFNASLSVTKTLVVDGLLTDQQGPQTVTLSFASNLGVGTITRELASGASVSIVDNTGNETFLAEIDFGTYQTDSMFVAQQDKTYFLRINLSNQTYESDVEKLLPVGQLDSIYFTIRSTPLQNEFQIYANSRRPETSTGQMRWRSSFIYEIITWPQFTADGPPPPCAEAVPCTCCVCWVYGNNGEIVLANSSNFVGNSFNNNLIATIPINYQQFQVRYYLKVDQLSLSTSAYNFWSLVLSQEKGAASLFQPASARIQGNMHSTTNPGQQVLGLFQVSSMVSKTIFISRTDVPLGMLQDPPFLNTAECTSLGTNIRPLFW
jgi:hypothetical protein